MLDQTKGVTTIDQYIAVFPKEQQVVLQKVRETIHAAVPEATEAIKYQLATFRLNDKNMVHFGAFKNHLGFYPTPSGVVAFADDLKKYVTTKGAIQFPWSEPIPYDLIARMSTFRAKKLTA